MNDFLQSIRGNQKDKRLPKTRRSFDNSNFNSSSNFQNQVNYQSTRTGNIKRPGATRATVHTQMAPDDIQPSYSTSIETFDILQELISLYTKSQDMMVAVQEKRVLAEERKAIALEEIAEYLRVITMPSFHEKFSSFKEEESDSQEPISSNFIDPSDNYDENSKHDFSLKKSSNTDIATNLNIDDALKTEVVEIEPIEGEVVDDDDYINNKANSDYIDSIHTNKESGSYTQDVEYSMKSSKEFADESDNDKKEAPKVIRRRKLDNTKTFISEIEDSKESKDDVKSNYHPPDKDEPSDKIEVSSQKTLLSREEILDIINSMRNKGKTFDEVAQHLINLGQPTFSGRGVWHAQTIHRICTRSDKKSPKSSKRAYSYTNSKG